MMILWLKLFLRQRGLSLEKISPNWFVLLVLIINVGLWFVAFTVAGNVHHGLCALDPTHTALSSKLLFCR